MHQISLFEINQIEGNILPYNGEAIYVNNFFNAETALTLFKNLKAEILWKPDIVKIFGKTHTTKRETAWYGDDAISYTYSGITRTALEWTETLQSIKKVIEKHCHLSFNSCLLNLYPDGEASMGWHSDDEKELGENPAIVSISLGVERRFVFQHKLDKNKVEILLRNGSLLIMKGECQTYWKHALPKAMRVREERINLTFRNIKNSQPTILQSL